jgi:hypothetical protein
MRPKKRLDERSVIRTEKRPCLQLPFEKLIKRSHGTQSGVASLRTSALSSPDTLASICKALTECIGC